MTRPGLVRAMTTWDVVALGINGVIGGGIFLAPATVARLAGSWSTFVYLFSGGLVALVALCFAEVGGRFGKAGGPFLYAEEAFGPFVGFQVGWITWIARVTSLASLANGLVTYAAYLSPGADAGVPRLALLSLLLGGLTVINILGVSHGAWAIDLLTVAKLAPLLFFVVLGLPHVEAARLVPGEAPSAAALAQASLFMIYVFSGFELVPIAAEEMIDPRRAVPKALLSTIGIVAVVYLSVHVVALGTLADLGATDTPLASAAGTFLGSAGAIAITLGALISICGTEGGLVLATPRLLYAMAERGHLPGWLCGVHPRFRTPYIAIAVQGGLALALAAYGSFEELAKLSVMARIVSYAATCLSLPVFRRRGGEPPTFTVPGGPIIPAAAVLLCGCLLASSSAAHLWLGAVGLAIGCLLYAIRRAGRPGNRSDRSS